MRQRLHLILVRVLHSCPGLMLTIGLFGEVLSAEPIDQYFYQGYVAETHGDYARAIPNWDEVLRLNPNNLAAFKNRGLAYFYQADYTHSINDYSEAIRRKPNDLAAFDGRGFAHFKQQDWDEAISDFTAAIRLNPKNAALYLNLGRVYLTRGDYLQAITNFTKTLQLTPRSDWAYNCRAVAHEYNGETAAAIADFRSALSLSPDYANVYVNCGNIFSRQAASRGVAITDYTEAIRLAPNDSDTYLYRAEAYAAQTNYHQALSDYNTAIQLNSSNADYYFHRSGCQFLLTNYAAALADSDQAVRLAPATTVYRAFRGRWREAMTNYDGACLDFSECIAQQPARLEYYKDRAGVEERQAKAWRRKGKQGQCADALDRARDDWEQVAAMDSHCLLDLGQFEGRKGQFENAIADFSEYLQTYPADDQGWNWRALAFEQAANGDAQRGELAEKDVALTNALADWNHLIGMSAPSERMIFTCFRGNFYARNGLYASALNDYHQAVALQPSDPYPLFALGGFLATCPARNVRNGRLALATLDKARALAGTEGAETDVFTLAAFAAADAETGNFTGAVDRQIQALSFLTREDEASGLRREMERRLALYQQKRPCHRILGVFLFD